MASEDPKGAVMAVCAVAAASLVGIGSAMFYSKKQVEAANKAG